MLNSFENNYILHLTMKNQLGRVYYSLFRLNAFLNNLDLFLNVYSVRV